MILEDEIVDNALSKSSFVGLLTLYFIKLRVDKKEAFNKSDLEKIRSGEYTYGYFIACNAMGFFDCTMKNDIVNIIEFNEHLSNELYKVLKEKAVRHDSNIDESDPKWMDDISRIEAM